MDGGGGRVGAHEGGEAEGEGVGEGVDGEVIGAETLEVAGLGGADAGVAEVFVEEVDGGGGGA